MWASSTWAKLNAGDVRCWGPHDCGKGARVCRKSDGPACSRQWTVHYCTLAHGSSNTCLAGFITSYVAVSFSHVIGVLLIQGMGSAPHDDAMLKYKFWTLGNSCAVIWMPPLVLAILQTSDPAKLVDYPTGSLTIWAIDEIFRRSWCNTFAFCFITVLFACIIVVYQSHRQTYWRQN